MGFGKQGTQILKLPKKFVHTNQQLAEKSAGTAGGTRKNLDYVTPNEAFLLSI
jgi:hypothetical protein